jgi:L-asparaginase
MESFSQKRVLIILTWGTIAGNVADNSVSEKVMSDPHSFVSILDNSIQIIQKNWNIEIQAEIVDLFNVDSSSMQPENWLKIIGKIQEAYDAYDAFIVLHGTNTMGYTASALSYALENINKPVILTGAQVPLWYLWSDATTNLVNSLRLAVWWYHEVKWVMAVFWSKIITWTRVKKGTDFDYDPFNAFQIGSLGQIGRFMRINQHAMTKHVSYLSRSKPLAIQARVLSVKNMFSTQDIVSLTEFPGMRADLFQSLVENSWAKAFVLRAFGAGDPSHHLLPAFHYLRDNKIPIVVTTQAPNGLANFQVNESWKYLHDNDLAIPAHDMSMESMIVKLGWLLAQNVSYELMKTKMLEDLHGEINIESELI